MKKLFYLLYLLPLSLLFSCDSDKDFSPVDMTLTLSGVTLYNQNFYSIAGDDVTIQSLTTKAQDGKNSAVSNVVFYLDGMPLWGLPGNPFDGIISSEDLPAGNHTLDVTGTLLEEGSSIMTFAASYNLIVVDNSGDIPSGAPEIGTYSSVITFSK